MVGLDRVGPPVPRAGARHPLGQRGRRRPGHPPRARGRGHWLRPRRRSRAPRQRLALTRALAGDARLVVLDEPTAHLDAVSEEVVVRAITALRDEGRTVVVIAHRTAVTAVADRVIDVRSQLIGATSDQEASA